MVASHHRSRLLIDIIGVGLMAAIVGTVGNWLVVGRAVATTPRAGGAGPVHRSGALGPLAEKGPDISWAHSDAGLVIGCSVLIALILLVTIRHGPTRPAPLRRTPLPTGRTGGHSSPTTSALRPTSTTGEIGEKSLGDKALPGTGDTNARAPSDPTNSHDFPSH